VRIQRVRCPLWRFEIRVVEMWVEDRLIESVVLQTPIDGGWPSSASVLALHPIW